MTGTAHAPRILIRGGRLYDHDGDVHQPATADLLIGGGRIERIAPGIAAPDGVEIIDAGVPFARFFMRVGLPLDAKEFEALPTVDAS